MKGKYSIIALIISYIVVLYTAFIFYPKWKQTRTEATISWDASGYYMYLPAFFIYKDIKGCGFKDSVLNHYGPTPDFQQAFVHESSGNYVMKYPIGQAIAMSPFFFIAHTYTKMQDVYPADGFSYPYQVTLGVGMLLFTFLGLFYLRKVLRLFFKDGTVAILLLVYILGTNYLNYSAIDQAMTHNTLFTLYTILLYKTIVFYKNPRWSSALIIGLLVGWMTIIRPTEIIAVLIPLLWGIENVSGARERVSFFISHYKKVLIAAIVFVCVIMIQLSYWKYATGSWIVYSYQDQGFSWLRPHIYNYPFSAESGWLAYTPMMVLPLIGLLLYWKYGVNKWAIILFTIINLYIVMAWDIWNYGGRAMVQSYPILAFPFCLLIERSFRRNWSRALVGLLIIVFAYVNIWWTYHAHSGDITTFGASKAYYWRAVGRWSLPHEYKKYLDNKTVYEGTPKNVDSLKLTVKDTIVNASNTIYNPEEKYVINKEIQYTPTLQIHKNQKLKKYLRVVAQIATPQKEWDKWKQAQFIIRFLNDNEEVQNNFIRIHRLLQEGDNVPVYIDALVPDKTWNSIEVLFWNAGSDKEVFISQVKAITFD